MAIIISIDIMLAKRKMSVTELSEKVGITMANLSILKNEKAKAIRLSTLEAICKALDCQPGDILEYNNEWTDFVFIKKSLPKDKVYSMWLAQLDKIENSTIATDFDDKDRASESSMDIGFKIFPIIDSISLNLLGKPNGRKYLEALGYSDTESYMMYAIFRNGIMHTTNPYSFEFEDGVVSWGLMSSSGSSGFVRHFPGYVNEDDPSLNVPADKAFTFTKLGDREFHASLSLDSLVAHVRYDLIERQKNDDRANIDFIVGQKMAGKVPSQS